jgi:hypothetical protein
MKRAIADREISHDTRITIGLAISALAAVASYIWAMASLPNKEYVDKQINLVRREVSRNEDDTKYIRTQVDEIKKLLIERKK